MQPYIDLRSARAGLLLVILASVLWGTGNAVVKTIYDLSATNALSVAFLRMGLAVPALVLICCVTLGRGMWSLPKRDLPLMLGAGALIALYQATFYASLPRVALRLPRSSPYAAHR